MRFFFRFLCTVFLCTAVPSLGSAQNTEETVQASQTFSSETIQTSEDNPVLTVSQTSFSAEKSALIGIWENSERIVSFNEDTGDVSATVVLKPFYRYYYDGTYSPHSDMNGIPLVVFGNGIYLQFWTGISNETGMFWRPNANRSEFSTDSVPIQNELKAYYSDESGVYEIRYWRTKAAFVEEKAELYLENKTVFLDKYIDIGGTVYTCAVGRRTRIRNPRKLTSLPQDSRISSDGSILVVGKPYLTRSGIENLENEIQAHNAIIYPPRNGRAKFVEPSIYKKLESMTIDDFELKPFRGRIP